MSTSPSPDSDKFITPDRSVKDSSAKLADDPSEVPAFISLLSSVVYTAVRNRWDSLSGLTSAMSAFMSSHGVQDEVSFQNVGSDFWRSLETQKDVRNAIYVAYLYVDSVASLKKDDEISSLRRILRGKQLNPTFSTQIVCPVSPKNVRFGTQETDVQKTTEMSVYSSLKLPDFAGTSADFHSWKKATKTEFEGILHGSDFLNDSAYCDTHLAISKVLVSRIKKSLKKGASAFIENVPITDRGNVAKVWAHLRAKYDKKTSRSSRIIKYWQQMVDLSVEELDDIPAFITDFEDCKASLKKEKLDLDAHDYPIIVRGHLLRSIKIDSFDERHDKLFQKNSDITIQEVIDELTSFYDTKIAKEEAYSSKEGSPSRKIRRAGPDDGKSDGLTSSPRLKNSSTFPKLPKDTFDVLGKAVYDRLNSWRALVMKFNNRTEHENKRLKETFFDGISIKATSSESENPSSSKFKLKRKHNGDDSASSSRKSRRTHRTSNSVVRSLQKVLDGFQIHSSDSGEDKGYGSSSSSSSVQKSSARNVLQGGFQRSSRRSKKSKREKA